MFIVEDGSGMVNSNTYCSVATFREYWDARGEDYSSKTDKEIEAKLVVTTQYIDTNYKYIGTKVNESQSLQFPRDYVLNGVKHSSVPREVTYATCEGASLLFKNIDLFVNINDGIKERTEEVGPIKTTYKYSLTEVKRQKFPSIYTYLINYILTTPNRVLRY